MQILITIETKQITRSEFVKKLEYKNQSTHIKNMGLFLAPYLNFLLSLSTNQLCIYHTYCIMFIIILKLN